MITKASKYDRNDKHSPEHLQAKLVQKRLGAMSWVSRRAYIRQAALSGERVGNSMPRPLFWSMVSYLATKCKTWFRRILV